MGLRESIQNLMPKVITALGTIAKDAIYHSTGAQAYDPSTGEDTESDFTDTPVRCVITSYTEEELKHAKYEIFTTDKKILIPSVSLSPVIPKMTDYITIDSVVYKVINKDIDPAEAMWEIQVRV